MILLTGATGYIGSHTWAALAAAGIAACGIDDFSNSDATVLTRLAALDVDVTRFARVDVNNGQGLDEVFERWDIDAVIHFAAFKSVAESVADPLRYYMNNVGGLMRLAETMQRHGCRRLVFSSSATVYGSPESLPIREDAKLAPQNPYGDTKLVCENLLARLQQAEPHWRIATLRYFNPVGAHRSGLLGENPRGMPNNLMPYVAQVASGRRSHLNVFGADYDTIDGSGVRDYLHVEDLAEGHVAALRRIRDFPESFTANLGTGTGVSVLQLVAAYERACGMPIPRQCCERRPGDVAACFADPSAAAALLGWRARRSLDEMCEDSWRFERSISSANAGTDDSTRRGTSIAFEAMTMNEYGRREQLGQEQQ